MSDGKALGDYLQILSGFPFPSSDFTSERIGKPIIRIRDLLEQEPGTHFRGNYDCQFLVSKGDILVGMDGDFNAVKWSGPQALLNQRVCKMTTKDPFTLDQNFLYHSLQPHLNRIHKGTAQTTVKHLSTKDLYGIDDELPPLPEQKKIAEILTGIENASSKISAQIKKLEHVCISIAEEVLTQGASLASKASRSDKNDEGWQMNNLSSIADFVSGYAFSSNDFVEIGAPCLRMGNLYQNKFALERSAVFLPFEFIAKYRRFSVNSGDLLMSMTGTAGKHDYGYVVEVPNNVPAALLNQRVGKIVPKNDSSKGFIKEVMRSLFYLDKLYEFGSGTKQANLTAKQIMGISIPIPNLKEQVKIANSLLSIRTKIDLLENRLFKQRTLHSAISSELLSGRTRVSI